jgi:hypothetical protein
MSAPALHRSRVLGSVNADGTPATRKCRWCERRFRLGFKAAAEMWRHARREHRQALETCRWSGAS